MSKFEKEPLLGSDSQDVDSKQEKSGVAKNALRKTSQATIQLGSGSGDAKPPDDGKAKKKQAPYLQREVKVKNPENIDHIFLLQKMHKRFTAQYTRWKKRSQVFKLANLIVTIIVILVQVTQVIIFQLPMIPAPIKSAIATILPAITGAILAIQLKLAWAEKGAKSKKAAVHYNKLANHAEYRLHMNEAGGDLHETDSVKMWNSALLSEAQDVPAYLDAY